MLAVEFVSHYTRETDRLGASDTQVVVIPDVDGTRGVVARVRDTEGVDMEGDSVFIDIHSVAVAQLVVAGAIAVPGSIAVDRQNAASNTSRITFLMSATSHLGQGRVLPLSNPKLGFQQKLTTCHLGCNSRLRRQNSDGGMRQC